MERGTKIAQKVFVTNCQLLSNTVELIDYNPSSQQSLSNNVSLEVASSVMSLDLRSTSRNLEDLENTAKGSDLESLVLKFGLAQRSKGEGSFVMAPDLINASASASASVSGNGSDYPSSLNVKLFSLLSKVDFISPSGLLSVGNFHFSVATDLPFTGGAKNPVNQLDVIFSVGAANLKIVI